MSNAVSSGNGWGSCWQSGKVLQHEQMLKKFLSSSPRQILVGRWQKLLFQSLVVFELRNATVSQKRSSSSWDSRATAFLRLVQETCRCLTQLRQNSLRNGTASPRHPWSDLGIKSNSNGRDSIQKDAAFEDGDLEEQNDATSVFSDDIIELLVAENVHRQPRSMLEASWFLSNLVILTESRSFESLLTSLCLRKNGKQNRVYELLVLEAILATNGLQHPLQVDLCNLSLAFGETPILLALRARDADAVLLLLRHGADVSRGWMGLRNAIEVLLFSPNQIYLGTQDIAAVESCLCHLMMVTQSVDFQALNARETEGYYSIHPDRRRVLEGAMKLSWMTDSLPVASLQHLCRHTIRYSMRRLGHRLPDGIDQLPLPVLLKKFLQLQQPD